MHNDNQKPIEQYCYSCQAKLRPGANFCINCGCTLGSSTNAPASKDLRQYNPNSFASLWKEIKGIGWLFGLLLFTSFVLGIFGKFNSTPWPEVIASSIDGLIVFVFTGFHYHKILPLLTWPRLSMRNGIELVILAFCFIFLMNIYFTLIKAAGVPISRVADTYQKAGWHIGSMLLLVSVVPAFMEELAFRGVIQTTLNHVFQEREAWLIQAALFSVLHLSPIMFPSHFLMGLCFGYMRRRAKSLYPGMALHAAWNAFVLCKELC